MDWTPAFDGAAPIAPAAAGDRHGRPEVSASLTRDASKGPHINGNGTSNGALPSISEKPGEVEETDVTTP